MKHLYCVECPEGCLLTIVGASEEEVVIEGNKCEQGQEFANAEILEPVRTLATTVRTKFEEVPVISVRTDGAIPKEFVAQALDEINEIVVETELGVGDTLIEDVAETGVRVIITSPALMQLGAELENKSAELSRAGGSESTGADADSSGAAAGGGYGNVSTDGYGGDYDAEQDYSNIPGNVLDDLGEDDHVGGFVGAAGEAVGVEDGEDYDEEYEEEDDGDGKKSKKGKGYRPKGRARIGRI